MFEKMKENILNVIDELSQMQQKINAIPLENQQENNLPNVSVNSKIIRPMSKLKSMEQINSEKNMSKLEIQIIDTISKML